MNSNPSPLIAISVGEASGDLLGAHLIRAIKARCPNARFTGIGGERIVSECQRVLNEEYPELSRKLRVMLPDENFRRVGQSMAAASLPDIR